MKNKIIIFLMLVLVVALATVAWRSISQVSVQDNVQDSVEVDGQQEQV